MILLIESLRFIASPVLLKVSPSNCVSLSHFFSSLFCLFSFTSYPIPTLLSNMSFCWGWGGGRYWWSNCGVHLEFKTGLIFAKVRVQKYSSDTRFTPQMAIFKQTIHSTAFIKILEIFPSARESLSVQPSASRSVKNQSCLQCS